MDGIITEYLMEYFMEQLDTIIIHNSIELLGCLKKYFIETCYNIFHIFIKLFNRIFYKRIGYVY